MKILLLITLKYDYMANFLLESRPQHGPPIENHFIYLYWIFIAKTRFFRSSRANPTLTPLSRWSRVREQSVAIKNGKWPYPKVIACQLRWGGGWGWGVEGGAGGGASREPPAPTPLEGAEFSAGNFIRVWEFSEEM